MSLSHKILFFLSLLGAFNGLVLGIYLLFFTTKRYLSNYLLGALLLVISIRIGKSVAYFFDYNLPKTYLQAGLTACFLIGPFLYFFVKSELRQVRKLPKSWAVQILSMLLVIILVGIFYPYTNFPALWRQYIVPLIYLQWGIYIAFSILLSIPILKKLVHRQSVRPFEKWVLTICAGVLLLFISYVWAILNITKGSYISGALYFSLLVYLIVFVLLYRRKTDDLSSLSSQRYADKKVNLEDSLMVITRLERAMTERELFKNPNLKLNDLAKEINVSAHQLSQILNDHVGKNFTLFVNEYRINEACKMLSSDNNLTVDAIGEEVGFNSKSTFFAAFKKIKELTPSTYRQSVTPDL